MKKVILLIVIVGIVLIGGGVGAAYYFNNVANYISTDDASVQGDLVQVSAPEAGILTDWRPKEGDSFSKGDVLGHVQNAAGKSISITAPADGTIIKSIAVVNQMLAAGTPLATTANLQKLYVVANVLETDINNITSGRTVHVTVDALPGTTFDGHVDHVGYATLNTFSLLPDTNTSGNYTKVAQRVPVVINLDNYLGKQLIPGLNASVQIER